MTAVQALIALVEQLLSDIGMFSMCIPNLSFFQGIRSEDRTFEKGFAPTAEIFYSNRIRVRVAAVTVSVVQCSLLFVIPRLLGSFL